MSGSAGGNRITRQAVQKTVDNYIEKVLKKFKAFKDAKISGSYNTGTKEDFGDIDLIVTFEGADKKEIKKELVDFFSNQPDNIIIPFKSDKYKGKKSLSTGEIVTILYPIEGFENEFVQIDNMVSLSDEESTFKKSFLDYPAEIQGLLLGLAKIVLIEENPQEVFKRLSIKDIPSLEKDQEFEFNLSSAGLTLRKVTLTSEFKETAREDIWKSSNWEDVRKLLQNYDIDADFEQLLDNIVSKTKNQRSKNRIKGIFKSMITVKSGEVNTPKGDKKTQSIQKVEDLLEFMSGIGKIIAEDVVNEPGICFYPGGFKPPHKGHFEAAKDLASRNYITQVNIIISPKERDGISAKESLQIWKYYLQAEPNPKITVKVAESVSPIKDIYDYIADHPELNPVYVAGGRDEVDDQGYFKSLTKAFGERVKPIPIDEKFGRISASYTRSQLRAGDIENFKQTLPDAVIQKGYFDDIFKLLSPVIKENFEINLATNENSTIKRYLEEFAEYCYDVLDINNRPLIKVITDDSYTEQYNSFGGYSPSENLIYISVNKRNLADILRSLCHEIVHSKQNEINILSQEDGNTGSDIENQANSIAGIIMRHYGQLKPEIFKLSQALNEQLAKGKTLEDIAKKHDPKGNYSIEDFVASLKKELLKGVKVEMEHTSDKKKAAKIAMDHLYEDPKYYTKLSKVGLEEKKSKIKEYFLKELFEKDLSNIEKISNTEYIVGNGDDIEAKYYFSIESSEEDAWSINWKFTPNNKNSSPEAWKQVTATSFKVLEDWLKNNNPPLLYIWGNNNLKTSIYKNYIAKLQTLLNNRYIIDNSDEDEIVLRSIEKSVLGNIKKRMKTMDESYEQALDYYQNGDINSKSKIERNNSILKKIKREVLEELYDINSIYLDIPKFTKLNSFEDKLYITLNEIKLSKDNAVETKGDLTGGIFKVGNKIYRYDIRSIENPYKELGTFYNISFTPEENITSTPTSDTDPKDYIKILSTMYKIILDFTQIKKPDYIGISSLDNIKNYHKIYATLTDNKYNNIPGYFRKDVNLKFNTSDGKGRMIVLKRITEK